MRTRTIDRLWSRSFSLLWGQIASDPRLRWFPPRPELVLSDSSDPDMVAQISGDAPPRIEISRAFILDLRTELQVHRESIHSLLPSSIQMLGVRPRDAVAAVEELLCSFVLLHESFHLLGGHLAWLNRSPKDHNLEFNEFSLGMSSIGTVSSVSRKRALYGKVAQAYMLETEADCTALQWILQSTYPRTFIRLFGRDAVRINDLPAWKRVGAFRLVTAALWLALRRMERSRATWIAEVSETHPLPGARLLAGIGTLLQEYARISGLKFDDQGGGHHVLSARDAQSMPTFFRRVLKPVLKADWSPGSLFVERGTLEASLLVLLPDYANYLSNLPMRTAAGRELLRMEHVRRTMYKRLAAYRHFPVIELLPLEDAKSS